MKKNQRQIIQRVLRDVSANFDGVKIFIKVIIEEVCPREKLSAEQVFYFFIFKGLSF